MKIQVRDLAKKFFVLILTGMTGFIVVRAMKEKTQPKGKRKLNVQNNKCFYERYIKRPQDTVLAVFALIFL